MAAADRFSYVREGRIQFHCPLCHHRQATNTIRKMGWRHHAQLTIATIFLVWAGWDFFGLKSLSFYLFFWACFEFVYRFRKRQALVCKTCGFDPFLYKQDVDKARHALKLHWQAKIEKENLFAGKKLKNYRTNGLNKEGQVSLNPVPPEQNANLSSGSSVTP